MEPRDHVPSEEWATVVRNAPIVSVDLVVRAPVDESASEPGDGVGSGDGGVDAAGPATAEEGVVLAMRENEPARGEWFVPGGRVRKGERLREAVHRVAEAELGVAVSIERTLGVYEHFYDVADVPDAGGKHYVPTGYVVRPETTAFSLDAQHSAVRVFAPGDLPDDLHPYTAAYLVDAGVVD